MMDHFAHLVDGTVNSLQPIFIFVALAAWVFSVFAQISAYRARKRGSNRSMSRNFIIGIVIFASVIAGEFAVGAFLKSTALDEINPKLTANIESVTVDMKRFDKASDLISALRNMHSTIGHHSHPTTGHRVFLNTSNGHLELDLCRDSDNPHEYWVFFPGFHSTRNNEIGRVFTNALDSF